MFPFLIYMTKHLWSDSLFFSKEIFLSTWPTTYSLIHNFKINYFCLFGEFWFFYQRFSNSMQADKMVFLHEILFSTWRIYTFMRVDLLFSTLKNVLYPQNIHLWLKKCIMHLKILFTRRLYTSVRVFSSLFLLNNYLCASWLKYFSSLENVLYPKKMCLCASVFKFLGAKTPL